MKHRAEMPDLTFHGLNYCDRCGEPLIPSEALCGMCRNCRAIIPPTPTRASRASAGEWAAEPVETTGLTMIPRGHSSSSTHPKTL
jgi:hypothetical protein